MIGNIFDGKVMHRVTKAIPHVQHLRRIGGGPGGIPLIMPKVPPPLSLVHEVKNSPAKLISDEEKFFGPPVFKSSCTQKVKAVNWQNDQRFQKRTESKMTAYIQSNTYRHLLQLLIKPKSRTSPSC